MKLSKSYSLSLLMMLSFFLVLTTKGQDQKKIDSLKSVLSQSISDSARVKTLNLLAKSFYPLWLDSMTYYTSELMELSEQTNNIRGKISALLLEELNLRVSKNYDKGIQKSEAALELSSDIDDPEIKSKIFLALGTCYSGKKEHDKALGYFRKSVNMAQSSGNIELIALTSNDLAVQYYYYQNDIAKAIEILLPLTEPDKESKISPRSKAGIYNSLASVYLALNDDEKTLSYFEKAYEAVAQTHYYQIQIATLTNTARLYRKVNKNIKSREVLFKALGISEKHKIDSYKKQIFNGIGYTYYNTKDYKAALPYFVDALKAAKQSKDTQSIIYAYRNLADVYYALNRFSESKNAMEKGKSLMLKLKNTTRKRRLGKIVYRFLTTIDSAQQNYVGSFENYKKYIAFRDTVALQEQKQKIANVELAYENEKKDKEIALLTAENDMQKLQADQQRTLKTGFIAGCVLLILFIVVLFNRYYIKKQAVDTIQRQKQAIEEKNNENVLLIQEIHHRVKNNLQIILSLLNAQKKGAQGNQKAWSIIIESQNKIKSMSLIHENLYNSDSFSKIPTAGYFEDLISHIKKSYSDTDKQININSSIEDNEIRMNLAVPLGLIVNELVTNSYKYAFDNSIANNTVTINFKKKGDQNNYKLEVFDNGRGLPDTFDLEKTETFGWQMIKGLTDQVNGKIEFRNGKGTGVDIYVQDVDIDEAA